jgi:hypothetical protein
MTPVWVPLLVAIVGLAGILYTQRAADARARDDRRETAAREERRAVVEAELKSGEWQREERKLAHARFLAEQWRAEHRMTMFNQVGVGDEPPEDWTEPMARELATVQIFGSGGAYNAACALMNLTAKIRESTWGTGRYTEHDLAKDGYLAMVKADLGLDTSS